MYCHTNTQTSYKDATMSIESPQDTTRDENNASFLLNETEPPLIIHVGKTNEPEVDVFSY